MSTQQTCYKVLLHVQNLRASDDLKEGLICQVHPEEGSTPLVVKYDEVLYFEIPTTTKSIQVSFIRQGKEVAKGNLVVPPDIASNLEVETSEVMRSPSITDSDTPSELYVEFNMTFINSEAVGPTAKKSASSSKTTPKKTSSVAAINVTSSAKKSSSKTNSLAKSLRLQNATSKIDTGLTKSALLRSASKEKPVPASNVETFLNKVVNKHFDETQHRVTSDLAETGDCVYLNRFNQLATSSLINASSFGASKREDSRESKASVEYDHTTSAEKLKEKFRNSSKSPSRAGPDMASILMDTESRRYVNEYRNQLEYLRNIVYVLDQKNQALETSKREADQLREEATKAAGAREELRKTLLETTRDLKDESDNFNKLVIDMETQNKAVLKDLKAANNKIDDLQTKIHAQELQLSHQNSELAVARAKAASGEIYNAQLQRLTAEYTASTRQHFESLSELSARLADLESALSTSMAERKSLQEENAHLRKSISELKIENADEKNKNRGLRQELEALGLQVQIGHTSVEVLGTVRQLRDSVLGDVNKLQGTWVGFGVNFSVQGIAQGMVRGVEDAEREEQGRRKEIEQSERIAREEANKLNRRNLELEAAVNELRSNLARSRRDNIELRNHVITLEQLLCVKEDVYSQLESVRARLESKQNDCDNLKSQVEASSRVLENMTEKVLELEKLVIYLKNTVVDKDDVSEE